VRRFRHSGDPGRISEHCETLNGEIWRVNFQDRVNFADGVHFYGEIIVSCE
jgi:hypothetical protein